ncbi:hypothetical protein AKJ16_DCAP04971 [Drosera capensis]
MAEGLKRKVLAPTARAQTLQAKHKSPLSISSDPNTMLVLLIGSLALAYQAIQAPPPNICGSPDGPPITAPRVRNKVSIVAAGALQPTIGFLQADTGSLQEHAAASLLTLSAS